MAIFDLEDIAAIRDERGRILCMKCSEDIPTEELTEGMIITVDHLEGTVAFCDECKEQI